MYSNGTLMIFGGVSTTAPAMDIAAAMTKLVESSIVIVLFAANERSVGHGPEVHGNVPVMSYVVMVLAHREHDDKKAINPSPTASVYWLVFMVDLAEK